MITMATHGRSGILRWIMGSVAERVLDLRRCRSCWSEHSRKTSPLPGPMGTAASAGPRPGWPLCARKPCTEPSWCLWIGSRFAEQALDGAQVLALGSMLLCCSYRWLRPLPKRRTPAKRRLSHSGSITPKTSKRQAWSATYQVSRNDPRQGPQGSAGGGRR